MARLWRHADAAAAAVDAAIMLPVIYADDAIMMLPLLFSPRALMMRRCHDARRR